MCAEGWTIANWLSSFFIVNRLNRDLVGLPEQSAALRPELLEGQNDLLEVERHSLISILKTFYSLGIQTWIFVISQRVP